MSAPALATLLTIPAVWPVRMVGEVVLNDIDPVDPFLPCTDGITRDVPQCQRHFVPIERREK